MGMPKTGHTDGPATTLRPLSYDGQLRQNPRHKFGRSPGSVGTANPSGWQNTTPLQSRLTKNVCPALRRTSPSDCRRNPLSVRAQRVSAVWTPQPHDCYVTACYVTNQADEFRRAGPRLEAHDRPTPNGDRVAIHHPILRRAGLFWNFPNKSRSPHPPRNSIPPLGW